QRRQLVPLIGHDVGGLADDRDPLLPGTVGPVVERLLCGGDGVADVLARPARELADQRAVDRRMGSLVPRALARLAVHEQRVLLPEPGPGDLDALLVGLVEVLVVGRHRRVGDAEPFLCHGMPPVREKRRVTWSIWVSIVAAGAGFPQVGGLRGTARSIPRFGAR